MTCILFAALVVPLLVLADGGAARMLTTLERSAEKECGPGWIMPSAEVTEFKEVKESSPQDTSTRHCYRARRMQSGTWVDALLECRNADSELVWVAGAEEAAWLVDLLRSYAVELSEPDWFGTKKGSMVNAHRYLYSERYGESARWKGGLFVLRPPNASDSVHDSASVLKVNGTVQNTCENFELSTLHESNRHDHNIPMLPSGVWPGDCFSLFGDRLDNIPCKRVYEDYGYICKRAYRDPAEAVSTSCIERCPVGWRQHIIDGHTYCYYVGAFTGTPITWYEALNQCRLLGMELWAPRRATETTSLNSVLTKGYFSKENSKWWVNAHSYLYSGSTLKQSRTGLYWPDGQPMGTSAAGDGFSVTRLELKPGDYCGAAHTLLKQFDNMVVNASSCTCPQSFGFLCSAPVCISSRVAGLKKWQNRQGLKLRVEERCENHFTPSVFILLLVSVMLNVVLVLVAAVVVIVCKRRRSKRLWNSKHKGINENNMDLMPLQDQQPRDRPACPNEYADLQSGHLITTTNSRSGCFGPVASTRAIDSNSLLPDSDVGTIDSNKGLQPQMKRRLTPLRVNVPVPLPCDTSSSPPATPDSAYSGTLASYSSRLQLYNMSIAESDVGDEMN